MQFYTPYMYFTAASSYKHALYMYCTAVYVLYSWTRPDVEVAVPAGDRLDRSETLDTGGAFVDVEV